MMTRTITFEEFQQEMIVYAKEIQGENYPGDDYYMQDECWREHFDDGDTAEDAVNSDMSYWDA
jgi:hypothetical protein